MLKKYLTIGGWSAVRARLKAFGQAEIVDFIQTLVVTDGQPSAVAT